jgi:hypothetical protein
VSRSLNAARDTYETGPTLLGCAASAGGAGAALAMKECSPDMMLLACSAPVLGVVDLVNRHRSSAACGTLFGTEGTHTSGFSGAASNLKRTPSYQHFTCSSRLMSPMNSCQFWSHYKFVLDACCCCLLHGEEPYSAGLDHTDHFIDQVPRTIPSQRNGHFLVGGVSCISSCMPGSKLDMARSSRLHHTFVMQL